jgi:hypothetical protein
MVRQLWGTLLALRVAEGNRCLGDVDAAGGVECYCGGVVRMRQLGMDGTAANHYTLAARVAGILQADSLKWKAGAVAADAVGIEAAHMRMRVRKAPVGVGSSVVVLRAEQTDVSDCVAAQCDGEAAAAAAAAEVLETQRFLPTKMHQVIGAAVAAAQ